MPASSASLPRLRSPSRTSESDVLVARCLEDIRVLTEPSVEAPLSPFEAGPPYPVAGARRKAVVLPQSAVPTVPRAIPVPLPAPSAAAAFARGLADDRASEVPARPRRRALARFALAVCAVVAIAAAVVAVGRSPIGRRPGFVKAVASARAFVQRAACSARSFLTMSQRSCALGPAGSSRGEKPVNLSAPVHVEESVVVQPFQTLRPCCELQTWLVQV